MIFFSLFFKKTANLKFVVSFIVKSSYFSFLQLSVLLYKSVAGGEEKEINLSIDIFMGINITIN